MTETEREALMNVFMLADYILGGLSEGLGTDDWERMRMEWLETTNELRQRLANAHRERSNEN